MSEQLSEEYLTLLGELGVESKAPPPTTYSAREQRIIAGFEEIVRFVAQHGRRPQHGEDCGVFERLYAVRLERLRASTECRELLTPLDVHGLLNGNDSPTPTELELSDEELLASLGIGPAAKGDLTELVHVRSRAEIKAAEEVAQRAPCPEFGIFKPLFQEVQRQLESGERQSVKYKDNAEIRQGDWFIVEGQKALVAEMGEPFISDYGRPDRRLRVIYDNATQSDLLLRSLQRALNRDKASRRIMAPDTPQNLSLFESGVGDACATSAPGDAASADSDETVSGTIYVLRSQSEHPFIAQHRSLIHKIGVTGGDLGNRIAGARQDPTFLLADVEVVATFQLTHINRHKLEALLHKFFSNVRLDMELIDRFDTPVRPKEWFLVPLQVIEQVVEKINDGTLDQFRYDVETAGLKPLR